MIVILKLPQLAMHPAGEFLRGSLFERHDEFEHAAGFRRTTHEDVDVVRHDAVGVDEKLAARSARAEFVNDPARDAAIGSEAATVVEAERHKVGLSSDIAFGGQADILAAKFGHGCQKPIQDAGLKNPALHVNLTRVVYLSSRLYSSTE